MAAHVLIAGGGIAGLASALALARRRHRVDLLEQAVAFSEVGAGIQLGPNVTRRLQSLGVWEALGRIAARPDALVVRSAIHDREIARLPLGNAMLHSYAAPYFCVHRADLHGVLLAAVRGTGAVTLTTAARVTGVVARDHAVCVSSTESRAWEGDALVGTDGLWSMVRPYLVQDSPPRATGHTAWRALVEQASLPASLRSTQVTVWLGPRLHAVAYPVRRGEALNVVVLAESAPAGDARDWDQASSLAALQTATGRTGSGLQALLEAVPGWRAWTLNDRPPLTDASQMAGERIALAGDAAHPMLPYLAQGAGMAIEDAVALAEALDGGDAASVPAAFARYAEARWQRNALVQQRARRNGEIFHATGLLRMGRDTALRLLGARLLDVPWLYAG
ncbi:FAD-dependent monooxygenase [Variovorax saccharolyticus]|uniref:FAD-dependent monooxygenase n=1 Tax=Variovorax saccharolyticus TaxID=3053516 RepID=UPI0025766DF4|nr:FAD-dependent monooxygenase [Variovorax sp. J31P216]MDM0024258.1 FAD-dependent monooxygenase [Variovorax sp. J31P216]